MKTEKKAGLWTLIVIYLTSLTAYSYTISSIVLGYIYNDFPGMEKLTILIATLPTLAGMGVAFAVPVLMKFVSKKICLLTGLVLGLIGAMMIYFGDNSSVIVPIIGATLTGLNLGLCGPVNSSTLPVVAPEKIRDKVIGWNEAVMSLGMVLAMMISGVLASDGNWHRAYALFYIYIPLIVLTVIFYPNTGKEEVQAAEQMIEAEPAKKGLPGFVWGLIIVQFISAFFNPVFMYNISDLVINEFQIGDSAVVGVASSVASVFGIFGGLAVAFWLRKMKGNALFMAIVLEGIFTLISGLVPNLAIIVFGAAVMSFTMILSQSAKNTYIGLGISEKQAATALALVVGLNSLGEFLCGYAVPFISGLFGDVLPSMNIKVAGIALIILGIASIPISRASAKRVNIDSETAEMPAEEAVYN